MSASGKTNETTKFGADTSASVAIEFAIVALPFLYVMALIANLVCGCLLERAFDAAMQDASREVRNGIAQGAGIEDPAAFVERYLCPSGSILSMVMDCSRIEVAAHTSDDLSDETVGENRGADLADTRFCLGGPAQTTIIKATYPMAWMLPHVGWDRIDATMHAAGLIDDSRKRPGEWSLMIATTAVVRTGSTRTGHAVWRPRSC